MDLAILKYNNYYNRTIKIEDDMNRYYNYLHFYLSDINFNPNDGIYTEHIIGGPITYDGKGDYLIVIDPSKPELISRWFIMEAQRTRGGQYKLTLKRDVVADYFNKIAEAPCFVEKGWVPNSDSAIFNKENMTFNQIKQKEHLLKDETNVPWLVGYYIKNSDEALTANIPKVESAVDFTVDGIENWSYYYATQNEVKNIQDLNMILRFASTDDVLWDPNQQYIDLYYKGFKRNNSDNIQLSNTIMSEIGSGVDGEPQFTINSGWNLGGVWVGTQAKTELLAGLKNRANVLFNDAEDQFTGYVDATDFDELWSLPGSKIYDSSTGKLYEVRGNLKVGIEVVRDYQVSDYYQKAELMSALGQELVAIYSDVNGITGKPPLKNSTVNDIRIGVGHYNTITLSLVEVSSEAVSCSVLPTANGSTRECPYNIFAMPYGAVKITTAGGTITTDQSINLRMMNALIEKYSGSNGRLIDAQLLPYCPIEYVRRNSYSGELDISDYGGEMYTPLTSNNTTVGYIFHCPETSLQFPIEYTIRVKNYKISNETEFCRLVSPNWNGMFEFTPAKNRGISGFNVDLELKPFQPYIHVAPQFNESGLYGVRNGDPIGLICGGDFSLTMTSDAWQTYERQNKNYKEIFDRNIQNIEVQQKYQRIGEAVGAAVGTLQGAAAGAMTGSMFGGGYGAAIGGVVGAGTSAIGGATDIYINDKLRAETIDYTKDQFGYQMGNIRALPDSLTKVNSLNPNNKLFPILEFYGCTKEESRALVSKLKYNGYSIGRIGTITEFKNPSEETYIKGQLILFEIDEDTHLAAELAAEINKGVRI